RRIVRNQFCTILVAPRQNPEYARILIVLARAVGNAPERNLLRRRIKAIFYEEKLFAGNVDYVVIVYKKMVTLPFDQLRILLVSAASETINK
ncbi:MAG TPA: ribonuclease P protein component, partial [Candidatus Babeliales bacterium]|nr:ribonuclease P protein component [Candidatus Babeliales bacterium]